MRKRILRIALVLVIAAVVVLLIYGRKLSRIGVGYVAEQTCACMFVSGRTLESCRTDLDGMAQKMIEIEPGNDEVRASSLGLHATARLQPGMGCTLVD